MNKVLKGLVAVAATAAMAVAGFAGASTAMAAEGDVLLSPLARKLRLQALVMYTLAIVCLTKPKLLLVKRPTLLTRSVPTGIIMIGLLKQSRTLIPPLP